MAGNANSGRRQEKPFRDALRIEAIAAENGQKCEALPGSLRWNARKLLEQGDVQSIKELADRMDGKPAQAIVGDNEYDPIATVTRVELVALTPKNDDRQD